MYCIITKRNWNQIDKHRYGATCTICNGRLTWFSERTKAENEQQNNVPNTKKHCSCRLSWNSKNRAFEELQGFCLRWLWTWITFLILAQTHETSSRLFRKFTWEEFDVVGACTLILMLPTQPIFDPLIILNLINTHILLNIFLTFFTVL